MPFQNFVNTFFAGFLVMLFTFLWSLLFVIPGIVKALSYSQTYFIMNEHPEYTGREAIDASRRMMGRPQGGILCAAFEFYWLVPAQRPHPWAAAIYVMPY